MRKKILCGVLVLIMFLSFSSPIKNANAEGNGDEVDISTSPHKVFFEVVNAKPGDTYTKTLKVQNNGSKDFKYLFSNRYLTGSEKFYRELDLTISNKYGYIYKGKLKDLRELDARYLQSKNNEDLTFSISIPYQLGNEYQNVNCEFQLKFYVEGTLGGILPVNGPKLPETGSNVYNILLFGVFFILIGVILQIIAKNKIKINKEI